MSGEKSDFPKPDFYSGVIRNSITEFRSQTDIVFKVDNIHGRIKAAEKTKKSIYLNSRVSSLRFRDSTGAVGKWPCQLSLELNRDGDEEVVSKHLGAYLHALDRTELRADVEFELSLVLSCGEKPLGSVRFRRVLGGSEELGTPAYGTRCTGQESRHS